MGNAMNCVWTGATVLSLLTFDPAHATTPDHSALDELLDHYVHDSLVDYRGLATERQQLIGYLDSRWGIDAARLDRDDRMALFINAYNAAAGDPVRPYDGIYRSGRRPKARRS